MGIQKNIEPMNKKSKIATIIGSIVVVALLFLFILEVNNEVYDNRNDKTELNSEKAYKIKLSNWLGNTLYYCDSTHQEKNRLELYGVGVNNDEITIIIPNNVILYIKKQ